MYPTLYKDIMLSYAGKSLTAASNNDDNSTIIDMAGSEGVIFFTTITDCSASGEAILTIEENVDNADAGMTALKGAMVKATSIADDDLNGKVLVVDVYRPKKRYVQGVRTSATQNIAFGEIYAIRYGGKKLPVTEDSTIAASTSVTSPDEI
jgi:hypothetical protein